MPLLCCKLLAVSLPDCPVVRTFLAVHGFEWSADACRVDASCELASTCAWQSSSWRATSVLQGLALAPSNQWSTPYIVVELPAVPIGLGISGRHITVSLMSACMHAQQRSAAGEKIAIVVSYLKHSGICLALEPKRSSSLSGTHGRHDWGDNFWVNCSTRYNGCRRLKATQRRLFSCEQQRARASTKDCELLSRSYLDAYTPRRVTVSCLVDLFVSLQLSCHGNTYRFPIRGPVVLLTKGATFAMANTCFHTRHDPT